MKEERKFYTAKFDRIFKATFCVKEGEQLFKAVLSTVLEKNIDEFWFLNPELPIKNIYDKVKVLDVLVLVDKEYIHIEINTDVFKEYLNIRNFSYFCELYSSKIKRGKEYDYRTKFIHIDLSYNLKEKYTIRKYYIMDKDENMYIRNIEIIEINMDYLKEYCYNNVEEFNKYKYLLMLNMTIEELNSIERDNIMEEYKNRVETLNKDEKIHGLIDAELDLKMCLNTEKKIMFENGLQKGIENNQKEIILNMYNNKVKIEDISKYTNISLDKINEIISNK